MEAERIRNILNIYAELKNKGEQFKDVDPCFIEGNEFLTKLWTTANEAGGGSGSENEIDLPSIEGGEGSEENEKEGQGQGQGQGKAQGKGNGQGEGEGQGDGEKGSDSDTGESGEGGAEEGGEKEGKKHGGDEQKEGEEKTDEQGQGQQPAPPIEEPEFEKEEEQSNPRDYILKFPSVTEMIYGVKVCNNTEAEKVHSIEKRLFVGIGIVVCRNLMKEAGSLGESILTSKKKSYLQVFDMLMLLIANRNFYDENGNFIINNDAIEEQDYKDLVLADKFMSKILPMLTVFNKDVFNSNQLDNAIDFCMARFDERNTMLVSDKYTDESVERIWGMLILNGDDNRNYKTNYYKYSASMENGKLKKSFLNIESTIVSNGKVDFTLNMDSIGEEFYSFVRAVILNYLNNTTQDVEQQTAIYRKKKMVITDTATNIMMQSVSYLEKTI